MKDAVEGAVGEHPDLSVDEEADEEHEGENDSIVPAEHEGNYHHLSVVILVPVIADWRVEDVAHLYEPRALQEREVASEEGWHHASSVVHLQQDGHNIPRHHVHQQHVQLYIHGRPPVQVVQEQHALHAEGEGGGHVVRGGGQRQAVVGEDVHYAVQTEEEVHGHMLRVAEVHKVAVLEPRHELSYNTNHHYGHFHAGLHR